MTEQQRPPRQTITDAKLGRIASDVRYAQSGWSAEGGNDVPSRFDYDHGSLTVYAKSGKHDLLYDHGGDSLRSNSTRALWHFSPTISEELIRGYRIARAAGLLGDHRPPCEELQSQNLMTPSAAQEITEVIRLKHREEGLY